MWAPVRRPPARRTARGRGSLLHPVLHPLQDRLIAGVGGGGEGLVGMRGAARAIGERLRQQRAVARRRERYLKYRLVEVVMRIFGGLWRQRKRAADAAAMTVARGVTSALREHRLHASGEFVVAIDDALASARRRRLGWGTAPFPGAGQDQQRQPSRGWNSASRRVLPHVDESSARCVLHVGSLRNGRPGRPGVTDPVRPAVLRRLRFISPTPRPREKSATLSTNGREHPSPYRVGATFHRKGRAARVGETAQRARDGWIRAARTWRECDSKRVRDSALGQKYRTTNIFSACGS